MLRIPLAALALMLPLAACDQGGPPPHAESWVVRMGGQVIGRHRRTVVADSSHGLTWISERTVVQDRRAVSPLEIVRETRRAYGPRGALRLVCSERPGLYLAYGPDLGGSSGCGDGPWRRRVLHSRETLADALWERRVLVEDLLEDRTITEFTLVEFDSERARDVVFRVSPASHVPPRQRRQTVRVRLRSEEGDEREAVVDSDGLASLSVGGAEFSRDLGETIAGVGRELTDFSLDPAALARCRRAKSCWFLLDARLEFRRGTPERAYRFGVLQLVHVDRRMREKAPRVQSLDAGLAPGLTLANETARELVKRIAAESLSPEQRVQAAIDGVRASVMVVPNEDLASADAVFAAGRGDCTELALAFTAVMVALGVPARVIGGYAATTDPARLVPHSWSEVYLEGEWREVDPTWNQQTADSSHLRLSRGRARFASLVSP